MTCDLFIFAGETSGDLHGEKLLKALLEKNPNLKVDGVGGPRMRAHNMRCLLPMEKFQVMGFTDVFFHLPQLLKQFRIVRNAILELQPKTVIFIDYPGFNLRMAQALRKRNFKGKLCHYICPSVWAWGKKRIPQMAKTLDLLLTILPFERECFSDTKLDVRYVGHPLIKSLQEHAYSRLPFQEDKKILGIFPGSRAKELMRNLPLQLRIAKRLLQDDPDLLIAISISEPRFHPQIKEIAAKEGLENVYLIPPEKGYDLMKSCTLALAKSGTVTLELALHNVPTVVTYAVKPIDQFIALNLLRIRLPFYCLVNIICQNAVFPELIGTNLTEDRLYEEAHRLLFDEKAREKCQQQCMNLKNILENKDASDQAANIILKNSDF